MILNKNAATLNFNPKSPSLFPCRLKEHSITAKKLNGTGPYIRKTEKGTTPKENADGIKDHQKLNMDIIPKTKATTPNFEPFFSRSGFSSSFKLKRGPYLRFQNKTTIGKTTQYAIRIKINEIKYACPFDLSLASKSKFGPGMAEEILAIEIANKTTILTKIIIDIFRIIFSHPHKIESFNKTYTLALY